MNHRPSGSLTVTKAIEGFLNYKTAEGLSARTVESYQRQLEKWQEYMGEDQDVARITTGELTKYLNWLRNEYVPHRFGSSKERLSSKTVRNFWVTLSSFFAWAAKEFRIPNPMKDVPAPKFKSPQVQPFTHNASLVAVLATHISYRGRNSKYEVFYGTQTARRKTGKHL